MLRSAFSLALALSSGPALSCTAADIDVKQFDVRPSAVRELARFVGEIVNRCADATAAQLQVTFRDKDGKVTNVEEFWPAGSRNLGPGVNYPFDRMMRRDPDAKTMSVRVIEVRQLR